MAADDGRGVQTIDSSKDSGGRGILAADTQEGSRLEDITFNAGNSLKWNN